MEKHKVLDHLLVELQAFLLVLDGEHLSGNAALQKGLLTRLLQSYRDARPLTSESYREAHGESGDEDYIYMNKVPVPGRGQDKADKGNKSALANGKAGKHVPAPQKSLPDLPPPRTGISGREPFPLPPAPGHAPGHAPAPLLPPVGLESPEGYYEEAQPYDPTVNDDGEAVSSSYESYDEEEVTKGKSALSAQHQWPSTEASIELMRDARICAFLWRKKWLGQWAKQLCVIKEHRLLCYKSSKDQLPLLDLSLLGCSVVYKDKHPKKREHKLKIGPVGAEAIVLGLQSKEQAEQWLRVIQDISPKPAEGTEHHHSICDPPRLTCTKGELSDRQSVASESGSSTDSHAETHEHKDVKKKSGAALKFSNLMNIGKKKNLCLDGPGNLDTSGYLSVLVNSVWRTRWCLIRDGQLCFYQDKGKAKAAQQAVPLDGCTVEPQPTPEHLYSFTIQHDGAQLATLEAKSSVDMGHWLGLLLSQTGSKTDPEELSYDLVNSERISSIVNAARTSLYLMQRRYSEPNTYIDSLPSGPPNSDDLYDDVASIEADLEDTEESGLEENSGPCSEENAEPSGQENTEPSGQENAEPSGQENAEPCGQENAEPSGQENAEPCQGGTGQDRVYLDLVPVRSFLHTGRTSPHREPCPPLREPCPAPACTEQPQDTTSSDPSQVNSAIQSEPEPASTQNGTSAAPATPLHAQRTSTPSQDTPRRASPGAHIPLVSTSASPKPSQSPLGLGQNIKPPQSPLGPGHSALSPPAHSPQTARGKGPSMAKVPSMGCPGASEVKLGKSRTEADMRRYTDERDRLEREREEVRGQLAGLKKERREAKEELGVCQDPGQQVLLEACLRQREEACRGAELRRVEVELRLMEVKESLRKAEAGPFSLGTAVDSGLLQDALNATAALSLKVSVAPPPPPPGPAHPSSCDSSSSPINSATALKSRPASIMAASKVNVMQKAKEWEKKSST